MRFLLFFCVLIFISVTDAFSQNLSLLRNNKESVSRLLTKRDRKTLDSWVRNHRLGVEVRTAAHKLLQETMGDFLKRPQLCDGALSGVLMEGALREGIITHEDEFPSFLNYLRNENEIDDVFLGVIRKGENLRQDLAKAHLWRHPRVPRGLRSPPEGLDLKKYFGAFSSWPDESSRCSTGAFMRLSEELTFKTTKERDTLMWRLNHVGLRDGHIDLLTFHRLEALRLNNVLDWDLNLSGYFDMLLNAKDKLTRTPEQIATHALAATYVSRKEKLTQRERLYGNFSPTQVMMMSAVIERLARRLDAHRVELIFRYGEEPGVGESQIYVLSPMEQYRVAIKLMRKELGELMRGDLFRGTGLQYEDIVASAFETGLLKSNELDSILKFEEFWNPKGPSRFRVYANFAFSVAGTATFYLPPPWNIMGAVALMFTQSRLLPTTETPDPDDNWNVII